MRPEEVVTKALRRLVSQPDETPPVVGPLNGVYPVIKPTSAPEQPPYAIYAVTGETVTQGAEGVYIQAREFRIEIHAQDYNDLLGPDQQAVEELKKTGRLVELEGVFDDWSEGRQPEFQTRDMRGRTSLEVTPSGVYRRIRTVSIAL